MRNEQLESLVDRCAERHGAHAIDVVLRGRQHSTFLEVYIDAEEAVTTELCSEVSRDISTGLKLQPLIDPLYQLTVSSPGIDRPLKFPWQYRKHVGRDLKIHLSAGPEGQALSGRLAAADEQGLTLETGNDREPSRIPFTSIVRAFVTTPW